MFFFTRGALASATDRDGCVQRVLGLAWPNGVPADEARLARSLSVTRAERAARTLAAVLLAERMGPTAPYARIAERFGLGRTTLYRYRGAWAADRSIRGIVAYEGRAPRAAREGGAQMLARKAARVELAADLSASNGVVARRIVRQAGASVPLALNTVVKLVQLERRSMMLDPASLGERYGRSLLIDHSALSNGILVDGKVVPLVAAFVVERGSGLILGYAAGPGNDPAALYRRAGIKALAFLARERLDSECGDVSVIVAGGSSPRISKHGPRPGDDLQILASNRARPGEKLASLLGTRLGALAFRPAYTGRDSWPTRLSMPRGEGPFTVEDADLFVGRAVERHNTSALDILREGNVLQGAMAHGAMAKAIETTLG